MAQVLLVDPSEVARKAMHGILARGGHRFAAADSVNSALALLRRNVRVDLVFTELKLAEGDGLGLIRELKANRLLRPIPVVVYTEQVNRAAVKAALDLQAQNYLLKPYQDDSLFAEIERAEKNPWRAGHFEEEKSFCRMMGLSAAELHRLLDEVRTALAVARPALESGAARRDGVAVASVCGPLEEQAESAGAWGAVEALHQLTELAEAGKWEMFPAALADYDFAIDLIAHWLDPQRECPDFRANAAEGPEAAAALVARQRAEWAAAPGAGRCPVLDWTQLQEEAVRLEGCPVIDSAAAAFQMVANGHPSCINPLMDLVARDPGLTLQMLIAANRAHPPPDEFTRIEDARLAVGQLGEVRLQDEAGRLVQISEEIFHLAPHLTWAGYWTFQRGVARIAQLVCRDLELYSLEATARTAGQLHDVGTLLLARLRPGGFQAIVDYARRHRITLRAAERLFLGGTTPQLGAFFADRVGLSRRFANVMRWIEDPEAATEDRNLVAIISLARNLCRQNGVGESGDPPVEAGMALDDTPQWAVLRDGLYPSFCVRKFERQVHAYCAQLRTEFSGHLSGTVGELVAAGAG